MTDGNVQESEVSSLLVRSTVHLPGIGLGRVGNVDPRVPYIKGCLERGFLVPVAEDAIADAEEPVEPPAVVEPGVELEEPTELAVEPPTVEAEPPVLEEELPIADGVLEDPADDDDDVG